MSSNCVKCNGEVISEFKEPICSECLPAFLMKKRKYYRVPYDHKAKAKILGARWCPDKKCWYAIKKSSKKDMDRVFFAL